MRGILSRSTSPRGISETTINAPGNPFDDSGAATELKKWMPNVGTDEILSHGWKPVCMLPGTSPDGVDYGQRPGEKMVSRRTGVQISREISRLIWS
jgi:hypothetical protein